MFYKKSFDNASWQQGLLHVMVSMNSTIGPEICIYMELCIIHLWAFIVESAALYWVAYRLQSISLLCVVKGNVVRNNMDATKRPLLIPPQFGTYAEKHGVFEMYKVRIDWNGRKCCSIHYEQIPKSKAKPWTTFISCGAKLANTSSSMVW